MNNLNNQISRIFNNLIESGTKLISELDYKNYSIKYEVDGKTIILKAQNYLKGEEPWNNHFSKVEDLFESNFSGFFWTSIDLEPDNRYSLVFVLDIAGKSYYVPELSRTEKAHVLDSLEQTIAAYESDIIDRISEATVEDEL